MSAEPQDPIDPPLETPAEPAPAEAPPVAYDDVPLPAGQEAGDPLRPADAAAPDDWGSAVAPERAEGEAPLFPDAELPPRRPETDEERRRRNPVYRVEEQVNVVRLRDLREGDGGNYTLSGSDLLAWVVIGEEVSANTQERAIEIATEQTGGLRGGRFAVTLTSAVTVHSPRVRPVLDFAPEERPA
jgi:hypothetical protein